MRKITSLVAVFLIVFPMVVWAETKVIGIGISGLHQKNGEGVYDKIVDKALVQPGLAVRKVYPPARAEKKFEKCQDCCLSPANKNQEFYEYGADIVKTEPMNTAKIYVFNKKGQTIINSIEGLKGKKVGVRHGMPYGKTFEKAGLKTVPADTIESNIRNLDKGRIDVFVAYIPDAYVAFKKLGIAPYPHDTAHPIAVHEDCLVCRGVSKSFVDSFNKAIDKMRSNGQLKKILGDSYVEK